MPTAHRPAKFAPLYQQQTEAPNFDLETDDIVAKLQAWDQQYGVEIQDVENDALTVMFQTLPEELEGLAADIYQFCPDVIDQHFGCFDSFVEDLAPADISPELAELIAGVDFADDEFGMVLLIKSLRINKGVGLWWD
ncbi:DUF4253 domain-containing protein [Thermosynechococcaceae cyanobacterium BACA0444]|uniref:DUF4253 domain-containing protein n=1 Tax=Pseudocalidococcus azoricus BACA0444 TaxID=2918990 RepID=A0AAE4FSK0_9CYAN|nr:DUF4253 domain-containing protein [Pseudocalidococcus azoricus]MDS3861543.1 DUF4253 domain-containing protein [Pseudocalidococcus azoricus BACA0444]